MKMNILTLTTDAGEKDHYIASLKGLAFSQISDLNIIDISHQIKPFDVGEAALQLKNCINSFPKGTVHVIGVDDEPKIALSVDDCLYPAIMKYKNQYFVSVDNGFFGSLIGEESPQEYFIAPDFVKQEDIGTFSTKTVLLPLALKILEGKAIKTFAKATKTFKKAYSFGVFLEPSVIKGYVVHIDAYGNLISNITKDQFEKYNKFESFTIYYRNKEYYIEQISSCYNTVPHGEKLALFNSNGYLEIAINRGATRLNGGAEQLFGVRVSDMIRIEFSSPGTHKTIDSLFD